MIGFVYCLSHDSWYWFRGLRSSSKGRDLRTLTIGELKQQRRQGIRKRPLKSEVALLQTLSRLFHLVQILFEENFSWSWILKDCIKVQGKKGSRSLVFTSFTKREIRHFNVVVVQWRQRNVKTSVMHVPRTLLFANREIKIHVYVKRQREFVPRDQVFPILSFPVYYFCSKISSFTPVLSIRIVLDSFYLLIFYFEKLSTWIRR